MRQNGRIVYQSQQQKDALDQTRVLSRDEIIEAMDKVDKEEAAAFKAEAEEAKKRMAKEQEQVTVQTEKNAVRLSGNFSASRSYSARNGKPRRRRWPRRL